MDHKVQSKQDIITDIFLEQGSSETDLAVNFDLGKCITKNKYT